MEVVQQEELHLQVRVGGLTLAVLVMAPSAIANNHAWHRPENRTTLRSCP